MWNISKKSIGIFSLIILVIIILRNISKKAVIIELKEIEIFENVSTTNRLFDHEFKYLLKSDACDNSSKILAVIIITSYYGNVETRSAMRQTISNDNLMDLGLRRVFLLGEAPNDIYTKQESINDEHRRFQDLIQGNFQEAYRNLTYKHLMGLKWANEYCKEAQYVIKMDDDIVVNLRKLPLLLNEFKVPNNHLIGYILRGMKPIREPKNKWYVTKDEYGYNYYPPFLSGWFYITTPKICGKLVKIANKNSYFWIDDLYITGILAMKLKLKQHDISKYFTSHTEVLQCCISEIRNLFDCDILIGPNGGDNSLFLKFNNAMKICQIKSCAKPNLNKTCIPTIKTTNDLGRGNAIIENYTLH